MGNAHRTALHNVEGKFRRYVPPSEADGLIELGHAQWRCLRCGRKSNRGRCFGSEAHRMVLQLKEPERLKRNSPSSLTAADAEAIVGITPGEPGAPADARIVHAAQNKLAAWFVVSDDRAAGVGARA